MNFKSILSSAKSPKVLIPVALGVIVAGVILLKKGEIVEAPITMEEIKETAREVVNKVAE